MIVRKTKDEILAEKESVDVDKVLERYGKDIQKVYNNFLEGYSSTHFEVQNLSDATILQDIFIKDGFTSFTDEIGFFETIYIYIEL